jgi:DNA-binding response OmpR family regulator
MDASSKLDRQPHDGTHIVVVDNDDPSRAYAAFVLSDAGYRVTELEDGTEVLPLLTKARIDLLILDAELPGLDGFALCQQIRRTSDVALIFLTTRAATEDRVRGLQLGADDYLIKPIEPAELLVRVQAVLRRCRRQHGPPARLCVRDLVLESLHCSVLRGSGPRIALTRQEFRVLRCLAARPGEVLTIKQLWAAAWDGELRPNRNMVAVYIHRLRAKLEPDAATPQYIGSTADGYFFLTDTPAA